MNRQEAIAAGVLSTKGLAARYFAGFDDSNRTRQAAGLPNHFAWCLGHMALTMHRAAEKIDGRAGLPEGDFMPGGHASGGGDASRFAVESVAFGSAPVDDPGAYPSHARCVEVYGSACDRLAGAVLGAADGELDGEVAWGVGQMVPRHLLAMRMIFHNGDHVGQLADLRRALGMKSVLV